MRVDADRQGSRAVRRPCVLILAGGEGRRVGHRDKGWIHFENEALVLRQLRRLSREAWDIAISANRTLDRYRALGIRIVEDAVPGFPGPLAAVSAGMHADLGSPLITVPVDAPHIEAADLSRLLAVSSAGERCTYAVDAEGRQPACAVWPRQFLGAIDAALHSDRRSLHGLQDEVGAIAVDFPKRRFGNLNALDEHSAHARIELPQAC